MARSDIKKQFVKELKEVYIARFSNSRPFMIVDAVAALPLTDTFTEGRVEYLSERAGETDRWERITSYKTLLSDPRIKSSRRIIEAEPGYGKSFLTLKIARDWSVSGGDGSFLSDVEVLILLQLRQLDVHSSIYECIQKFVLPKTTKLTIQNIRDILLDASSVLLLLDGVDECPTFDEKNKNDVTDVMGNEMFQHFEVLLTTRSPCSPKLIYPNTKRIRLNGFDKLSQDEYLHKLSVKGNENNGIEIVKESLHDNHVLFDLCRNPLFFVAYANLLYHDDNFFRSTTLTKYFEQMISCFHEHFARKADNVSKPTVSVAINDELLNKVAYETLLTSGIFGKDYVCDTLGTELYDRYLQIGILREIHERKEEYSEGEFTIRVRFIHALVRDWYAAQHLVDAISKFDYHPDGEDEDLLVDILDDVYPHNFQNVYRFACGKNLDVAKRVINYIRDVGGYDQFSVICIFEQLRTSDSVLDNIQDLCSGSLHISETSTKLWQRLVLQILSFADQHGIAVSGLVLQTVMKEIDSSRNEIVLKSGIRVPTQNTLKKFHIEMIGSEWTEEDFHRFVKYASKCENLTSISLANFVLPNRIKDVSCLSDLRAKGVTVLWYPTYISCRLNLQSGKWEHASGGLEMTERDVAKLNDLCRATSSF